MDLEIVSAVTREAVGFRIPTQEEVACMYSYVKFSGNIRCFCGYFYFDLCACLTCLVCNVDRELVETFWRWKHISSSKAHNV